MKAKPLPEALRTALQAPAQSNGHQQRFTLPDEKVPPGKRHSVLVSAARSARARGLSQPVIEAELLAIAEHHIEHPNGERKVTAGEIRDIAEWAVKHKAGTLPGSNGQTATYPTTTNPPVVGEVGSPALREQNMAELREKEAEPLDFLPMLGKTGYLVRGWCTLLAGYPKAGKTELLTRLCQEWAGERVLYFTEEPETVWQARLEALPGPFHHGTLVFALGGAPQAILDRIGGGEETVVIIDTARNLLNIRDENDNSEVARVLTPYVAACRWAEKTLVLAHHLRKGGGEHGEGITGGHAFLGIVDVALEVGFDAAKNRRRLRGWGRVIQPHEVLYEMLADGSFTVLGSPAALMLEEVKERVFEVLDDTWQTRKQILAQLDEPKPSFEQMRLALSDLGDSVERQPAESKPGATYRYRRPTYLPPSV